MLSIQDVSTKEINRINKYLKKSVLDINEANISLIDDNTRLVLKKAEVVLTMRFLQIQLLADAILESEYLNPQKGGN